MMPTVSAETIFRYCHLPQPVKISVKKIKDRIRHRVRYMPRNHARPGEVPFKVWLEATARELGIKTHTLFVRLNRKRMKWPKYRRVNQRVIFVKI